MNSILKTLDHFLQVFLRFNFEKYLKENKI